jgi:hypothetical protein
MRSTRGETKPFLAARSGKVARGVTIGSPSDFVSLVNFIRGVRRSSEPPKFRSLKLIWSIDSVDMCQWIVESGRPTIWEKGDVIVKG